MTKPVNPNHNKWVLSKQFYGPKSRFRQVESGVNFIAVFILTGPYSNIVGCSVVPRVETTEWMFGHQIQQGGGTEAAYEEHQTKIDKAFDQLQEIGFIRRCPETEWTWIVDFLKDYPFESNEYAKAAKPLIEKVPRSLPFYDEFHACFERYGHLRRDDIEPEEPT